MYKSLIFKTYKSLISDIKNANIKISIIVFLSIFTSFIDVLIVSMCAFLISDINNSNGEYKFLFTLINIYEGSFNSLQLGITIIALCIVSLFIKIIFNYFSCKIISLSVSKKSVYCFNTVFS